MARTEMVRRCTSRTPRATPSSSKGQAVADGYLLPSFQPSLRSRVTSLLFSFVASQAPWAVSLPLLQPSRAVSLPECQTRCALSLVASQALRAASLVDRHISPATSPVLRAGES